MEVSLTHAYIVQVGGAGNGQTKVWEVAFFPVNEYFSGKFSKSSKTWDSKDIYDSESSSKLSSIGEAARVVSSFNDDGAAMTSERGNSSTVYVGSIPQVFTDEVSAVEIFSVYPDKFEVTCCYLSYHDKRYGRGSMLPSNEFALYLGSSHGTILRYSFKK